MIKSMYFGDKVFETKDLLLKALKENEERIIDIKKSVIHKSYLKGQGIEYKDIQNRDAVEKELSFAKENYIYPIINSTNWLDTHDDVHLTGCYAKSVQEQQGKVYFVDSHGKNTQSIISYKSDVKMIVKDVEWNVLGKDIVGKTQCLIFEIRREDVKEFALNLLDKETEIECSLAMRYADIFFAVNSSDKYYADNKQNWDNYIDSIANKQEAIDNGYFFGVKQLQIMGEGSICPITGGSNSATSVYMKNIQPDKSTEKKEAVSDTSQKAKSYLFI